MKIDTFIQLIKDLRQNQINDDADPNNTVIQMFTSPYDVKSYDDSVRILKSSSHVWGDGKTYTAYDSNNQAYLAPSCGWYWGAGGSWSGQSAPPQQQPPPPPPPSSTSQPWTNYQSNTWSSLGNNAWSSM